MQPLVSVFRERWSHIHAMTLEFAKIVPDAAWEASPQAGFAPFHKQLRHVVCVRGVYNEAIATRRLDFGRKHAFYSGDLTRDALVDGLEAKHLELLDRLEGLPEDLWSPEVDLFGTRVSFAQYLYGYVQHEAIHHGQWSLYAAAGGYETPALWRLQWGLGAGSV